MKISKEHLYLWCHNAGVYNKIPQLGGQSDYTPVEAAAYMGIENIIMVVYGGKPVPPFAPLQEKFQHFKKVLWSLIGDSGSLRESPTGDLPEILALQQQYPNLCGGMMDDFFNPGRQFDLDVISSGMRAAGLPLWVVLYTHQLDNPEVWTALEKCDVINLWTWNSQDLRNLEKNLSLVEARMPRKKIALGCYLWNFGGEPALGIEEMEYQCNFAASMLKQGRIQDVVILGSPLIGMQLETIPWTRNWIRENFE